MFRARYQPVGIAALLTFVATPSLTDEPALVAPVGMEISAETLAGRSPYDDLPGRGFQRLLPDEAARLDEIHPAQAELINATYVREAYRSAGHCRAGWPECIRMRATPSNTPHYCGYQVGGGAAWFGEGYFLDEGTYGWDYFGLTHRKRVALHWWHGKFQGGVGQYQTDGPQLRHE